MKKTYIVKFDTQRHKVYSSWEFITEETSKKAAIARARELWAANGNRAHMYHCKAERVSAPVQLADYQKFSLVSWTPGMWGYEA